MFKNKKIRTIVNVFFLLMISAPAMAAEDASRFYGQWPSVLPPLLAILFALVFKRVIPALFLGICLGAWLAPMFGLSQPLANYPRVEAWHRWALGHEPIARGSGEMHTAVKAFFGG